METTSFAVSAWLVARVPLTSGTFCFTNWHIGVTITELAFVSDIDFDHVNHLLKAKKPASINRDGLTDNVPVAHKALRHENMHLVPWCPTGYHRQPTTGVSYSIVILPPLIVTLYELRPHLHTVPVSKEQSWAITTE